METGNNGALLGKAIFAGVVLFLLLCCAAAFCGCAGAQHQNTAGSATVADVEAVEAELTATLPSPNDPEAWNRGLGLLVSVVARDQNGRMAAVGVVLFANFGNNTNTVISDELAANLRLVAELTTRVADLQGVAIISFAGSDENNVNLSRAVAISQALVTYGVEEAAIAYQVVRPRQSEETEDLEDNTL